MSAYDPTTGMPTTSSTTGTNDPLSGSGGSPGTAGSAGLGSGTGSGMAGGGSSTAPTAGGASTGTSDTGGLATSGGLTGTAGLGSNPSSYGQPTTSDMLDDGQGITGTARQVAEGVAAAAGDVTARIPEVAQTARGAWEEADRLVHQGSDSTLQLVGAASVGFAVGLLVGGAHRLLVILSLIPAALIGATIIERMERGDTWSEVLDSDTLVQGG